MKDLNISLRTRLTLIYGGLFLLMVAALEGITFLATSRAIKSRFAILLAGPTPSFPGDPATATGPSLQFRTDAQSGIAGALDRQRAAILNQLIQSTVIGLVAVAVLAIILGYVVSGRMLRPLRQITATGRRLTGSTLHERIALTGPNDEIKELADTFDSMLDRLHQAFDSQRRFIANAAHELRTPLAINRALIDVAAAKPGAGDDVKALAPKLLDTITRQELLLNGLLLLARSEHQLQERTPLDLATVTAGALEQLTDAARALTITPTLDPAPSTGEALLLERCAINLLSNAITYNTADGYIWVATGTTQHRAWLQIENTGPPVQPEQAETIFEPFRRLGTDRTGSAHSAGLGLSIVRAIMHAHGGHVEARPRTGGGLIVVLSLPAHPTPSP